MIHVELYHLLLKLRSSSVFLATFDMLDPCGRDLNGRCHSLFVDDGGESRRVGN